MANIKDWLVKRITVEELEAAMLLNEQPNEKSGVFSLAPLDNITNTDAWKKMKSALIEGDEIWEFCSPGESWARMMGTTGICVVRNDEVIMDIVTTMN